MHHRYETNGSNHGTISSTGHHGAFLGTAREKRDKLLRKANISLSRHGTTRSWQPASPPPARSQSTRFDESFFVQSRPVRSHHHHSQSRTQSVDGILSPSNGDVQVQAGTNSEQTMPRTASQNSLNNNHHHHHHHHRASPCPSDVSFSFSNPKYFVRTNVLRPAPSSINRSTELHYENVIPASLFGDRQRFESQLDDSNFRSPTPGPDYSGVHSDSITLDELIDRLTPTAYTTPEVTFLYPALLCSRSYIEPTQLLNRIARAVFNRLARCSQEQRSNLLLNFLTVLSHWSKTFSYDFRVSSLMSLLESITNHIVKLDPFYKGNIRLIMSDLMSKLNVLDRYEQYLQLIENEISNRLTTSALTTDIYEQCPCPKEFAHQLTHIELDRLKAIGAEEFINMRSSDSSPPANAQTTKLWTFCLEAYINWSNRLSSFVTTEIIKHLKRHIRVKLLNYFIDAALECFNTGNFNSMMGILGGLNMLPIKRLKKTWSKANRAKLETLEKYMNPSKNFCIYRSIVKAAMQRAEKHQWQSGMVIIPFLSIFLRDIYFIKVRSPDYITNDQGENEINLKKFYILARFICEEFMRCKSSKCSYARYENIINYVVTSPVFSEDSLMAASFECEPAETENDREQLRTLRNKLGF